MARADVDLGRRRAGRRHRGARPRRSRVAPRSAGRRASRCRCRAGAGNRSQRTPSCGSSALVPSVEPSSTTRISRSGCSMRSWRDHRRQIRRLVVRRNETETVDAAAPLHRARAIPARRRRDAPIGRGPHAVRGLRGAASQAACRPHHHRRNPGDVARQMERKKEQRGRIAKPPRRADAGGETFGREARQHDRPRRAPTVPTARRRQPATTRRQSRSRGPPPSTAGATIIAAGDTESPREAPRMFGHEIEAAVAEPVLLHEVAAEPVAPPVHAARLATEHQPVAGRRAADSSCRCRSRSRATRRTGRRGAAPRRGTPSCRCRHDRSSRRRSPRSAARDPAPSRARSTVASAIGRVVALRGGDVGIVQRREQAAHPAGSQHDVLIDLADDRIPRGAHAGVDRGGGAAAFAGHDPAAARSSASRRSSADDPSSLPIVDDDDFERAPVGLREDRLERLAQAARRRCAPARRS